MKLKRAEYFQVVGLLALAQTHMDALSGIEDALCKLLRENDRLGHVGDAIFSTPCYSADTLIKKLTQQRKHDAKIKARKP